MDILQQEFMKGFIRLTDDAARKGWHERNGGNLSYRMKPEEVSAVRGCFAGNAPLRPIGVTARGLAGEYFLVTGSGK